MSGFKSFILKGGLVEFAVAVIMATAFAAVVTAFVAWLTGLLPKSVGEAFKGAELGDIEFFLNATIAFVIMGAIVYFLIVVPYTKAKDRYFPAEAEADPADVALLTEIRDLLASKA